MSDLATGNARLNNVSVLLGLGDGTFRAQQIIERRPKPLGELSGEFQPTDLSVADFNNDGVDDLAASMGIEVLLLFGDKTSGVFSQQQSLPLNSSGIENGDFNGDGVVDLAGHTGSGLSVFYGESNTEAPLVGDADGDGEVGFADFRLLSKNFGKVDAVFADGDFDGDGIVAFADFLILWQHFGTA